VLARILTPQDFGVVALVSTFVLLLSHIQASGLGGSLVYRRTDVKEAAGTALVFSALTGICLFGVSFAAAPLIAHLFHLPQATSVMRVMGLIFILGGISTAPAAILEREFDFRSRAKAELLSGVAQVGVSVGLAFSGAGVWSLVVGLLAGSAVQSAVFWLLVRWRPSPALASWSVFRDMVRYGRYVSAGGILGLINGTIDNMFIARLLNARALGIYAITFRLADFPTGVIGYVVGRVMFPAYSAVQDDMAALRRAFVQNLQRVALMVLPVAVTLAVAARPIVLGLLGEKWLAAVTPLRVLAGYTVVRGFASCAGPLFQALGRPQLVPLWMIPHTVVVVPALVVLAPRYGLTGAAFAMLAGFSAAGIPAFIHAAKLLDLGVSYLARALAAAVACSAVLGAALILILVTVADMSDVFALFAVAITAALTYAVAAATIGRALWTPILLNLRGSK
jgi:O-antigen/teichoic acid export membrane protein